MGGNAFLQAVAEGQPTLITPRMSPDTYEALKSRYLQLLQEYFTGCEVSVLKEAPEKPDYGDMDFMVCSEQSFDLKHIANFLGAAGVIGGGHGRCSVAVPQDGSRSLRPAVFYKPTGAPEGQKKPSTDVNETVYAQVDIEIVRPDLYRWHAFYASYGDLAGLLGAIMHNLGFTVSDRGLFLRLRELDDAKQMPGIRVADKEGLLFLSNEPQGVMDFLAISPEKYEAGFSTMKDFYTWLAESRLITPEINQLSKRKNNSKQRQKERKRTIITNFFDEFLPAYLGPASQELSSSEVEGDASWPPPAIAMLRQQYGEEAARYFHRQEEASALRSALLRSIENQKAEQLIKPIIAEHSGKKEKKLSELVRAFRRRVNFDANLQPYVADRAHTDQESELCMLLVSNGAALRDERGFSSWIKTHWERLKELERRGSDEELGGAQVAGQPAK